VCSKGLDSAKVPVLTSFLRYLASADTQKKLADIGYATLPESVLTKVGTAIDAIS
jgi:phosphate transport system substrate-binding protein